MSKSLTSNVEMSYNLLRLFPSYLKNRYQYVAYRNYESHLFSCPPGIPQSSNLGPLLFLLIINDKEDYVTCSKILLYADDIMLYKSGMQCWKNIRMHWKKSSVGFSDIFTSGFSNIIQQTSLIRSSFKLPDGVTREPTQYSRTDFTTQYATRKHRPHSARGNWNANIKTKHQA